MAIRGQAGCLSVKPENALGLELQPDDPSWMQDAWEHLACGTLFLTLGEKGMAAHRGQDGYPKFPTMAQEVCDVFGAGHTVTALMAVVRAAGGTVMEAAVMVNHAAAQEVGKAGVATVTPAEILTRFRVPAAEERS